MARNNASFQFRFSFFIAAFAGFSSPTLHQPLIQIRVLRKKYVYNRSCDRSMPLQILKEKYRERVDYSSRTKLNIRSSETLKST